MRKTTRSVAVLLLAVSPVAFAADQAKLPDGPGKETTARVCGACHGVEIAVSRRESRDGWVAVVEDMIQRGAKGTDEEFGEAVEYLAAHFSKSTPGGKINVNSATAKDLSGSLAISDQDAAAIVQYREEKGKFKSFEDLAKVPGIDVSKLEEKKARLAF
jgi:competence protein ComEA